MKITRGLIIRKPHIDNILNNGKRLEMRSSRTDRRGHIGLIESASGLIVGTCELVDCWELPKSKREYLQSAHQVKDHSLLEKWKWAWELDAVNPLEKPIPYTHPQVAVIWVKLDLEV